jgi:hypothetical protein
METLSLKTPTVSRIYDDHTEKSADAQRRADRWMLPGAALMTTAVLGPIGFPLFLRGVALEKRAMREGLTVRPLICTLIGYLTIMDSGLNSIGWSLDMFAHHSLITRTLVTAWGNMFDSGYFWHYNELWIGGAGAPGEKAWEFVLVPTVFSMRMACGIGFLKMKRWAHQWLILTSWFGVIYWVGYVANMTVFADLRYTHVVFPVVGWWLYDMFYITPFLSIPYLHTVNREIFTD